MIRYRYWLTPSYVGDLYKTTLGRRARQWSAAGAGILLLFGSRSLLNTMKTYWPGDIWVQYIPAVILLLAGVHLVFKSLNWPRFADFLIATEAEMTKVSWSSKEELTRSTIVVLTFSFFLAFFLFFTDFFWKWVLKLVGVLPQTG